MKFIESTRLQMSAIMGLLTPQQRLFTDEFSQVLMYESSNYDNQTDSSDDGQGKVQDKAKEMAIRKLIRSKNITDQRFIDMIRVKQAKHHGFRVGFKGLNKKVGN